MYSSLIICCCCFHTILLQVIQKLKKYLKDPNFVPDKMAYYSVACESFCQWVLAVEHYCKVFKVVHPKKELHKRISADLEVIVGKLQAKEVQLKEVHMTLFLPLQLVQL